MITHVNAPALPLLDADRLAQAAEFVRARCPFTPRLALILGSGSGAFADHLQDARILPTPEIPGYPHATVDGQAGRWLFGTLAGKNILAVQRGAHIYEGCEAAKIGFMIHLLAELGIQRLLLATAASGLNPHFAPGDLMLMEDHINLMFANPLRGQHRKEWGRRWPDMHAPYDPALQKTALQTASQLGIALRRGVVLATRGPSYETAAEIRMARCFGADAVTRSIIPEVIVAISRRMQVLGLACITNMATGLRKQELDHREVMEIASRTSSTLVRLLIGIVKRIA